MSKLSPCEAYRTSTAGFTRTDLWLVAAMVVADFANTYRWGLFYASRSQVSSSQVMGRGLLDVVVLLLLIGLLLAARRQSWRTVGLGTTHLRRSLVVGVAVAAVFLAGAWLIGAARGHPATNPLILTYSLPYYLVVIGFFEELLWRGFITTRLAAAFRHRWVGVAVAGLLFGLSHLAMPLARGGELGAVLAANWLSVLIPFAWHFVLWWLYAKFDSLAAPTLLHLAMNLSTELIG